MQKSFISLALVSSSVQLLSANLILNGSFETRTSPPAPTSGFSFGLPDFWTDPFNGNTYLVHESHGTVPGNSAIDGDIIVGGGGNIYLTQTFTTFETGPLDVSWFANNEASEPNNLGNFFHETAVVFNDAGGNFIDWSGYRENANPTEVQWFEHNYTTSTVFTPGNYQVQFFIGGRSSADNLVVSQIPEPSSSLVLAGLLALGLFSRRRD